MNPLLSSKFEACTKCVICTEYCPVSDARADYPGPKQSGPDGERQRLKDASFYNEALKLCTNCKRCEVVCPSDVKIGDVIALAREKFGKKSFSPRDAVLSHTDFMGSMAVTAAPIVNFFASLPPVKYFLEKFLKIPSWRTFPKYASQTFRAWYFNEAPEQKNYDDQVSFFHGCFINYNNPSLGRDVVSVLNALGVGVRLLESERCCGVPLIASGFFDDAKENAGHNKTYIEKALDSSPRIVCASSTCAMVVRDEYPDVLGVDNSSWRDRFDLFPRHVYRLLESGRELFLKPIKKKKVAYHTACHMERLGWSAYSIELLKLIPGIELTLLPSQCCGIAGTYGFKLENSECSQTIGSSLFRDIKKSGAELVVSECETCKMQIEMSAGIPCENPATVLSWALG
jgi:glycerol-3-phosphate dehydrogenase subunit C